TLQEVCGVAVVLVGEHRRRRADHHDAEADEREHREQQRRIDARPEQASEVHVVVPFVVEAKSARNVSPRCAYSLNWSNDAHAGDIKMTSPGCAAAAALAVATSRVPASTTGMPPAVKAAAMSGASFP